MKFWTGIGSRDTPISVQLVATNLARYLSTKQLILRSGGADGADIAFERGAKTDLKEIWLPWLGFNGNKSKLLPSPEAFIMAKKYHPHWSNLKEGAQKLHARNCHQVLGKDLKTPSKFVICYTTDGKISGGTGQAMRIATDYQIPILNLFNGEDVRSRLELILEHT